MSHRSFSGCSTGESHHLILEQVSRQALLSAWDQRSAVHAQCRVMHKKSPIVKGHPNFPSYGHRKFPTLVKRSLRLLRVAPSR
ncbi:MAG: hypothetical protein LV473_22465, partial [Nitrospira sp.]|nr:hypothetical protein [Nitrospira sp.]